MGRPTEYRPELCDEIIKFFDREPYREISGVDEVTGKPYTIKTANDLPTLAGFCASIGIHRGTLNTWEHEHSDFRDAVKKCKEMQESFLITNGMNGSANTVFSIFVAKNITSLKDKQEVEVSINEDLANRLELARKAREEG